MKKFGPALKVTSVILQLITISARFAAIPLPDLSVIIDQVVECAEKAQEIFENCEMGIKNLKGLSKEDIMKRMNQNGTSELQLPPLEGDIIGTFKKENMFGESQVFSFLSFSFLFFFLNFSFFKFRFQFFLFITIKKSIIEWLFAKSRIVSKIY